MSVKSTHIAHHFVYGLLDNTGNVVKVGVTYQFPYRAKSQIQDNPGKYTDYLLLEDVGISTRKDANQREKHYQIQHECLDGAYLLGMSNTSPNFFKRANEKVICCLYCREEFTPAHWKRHSHQILDKKLSESPITLIPLNKKLRDTLEPIHLSSYRDLDALGLSDSAVRSLLDGKWASVVIRTHLGRTRWIQTPP